VRCKTERGDQGDCDDVLTGSGDEGRWTDFEDDDGRRPAAQFLSRGAPGTPDDGKRCSGCGSMSRCSRRRRLPPTGDRTSESATFGGGDLESSGGWWRCAAGCEAGQGEEARPRLYRGAGGAAWRARQEEAAVAPAVSDMDTPALWPGWASQTHSWARRTEGRWVGPSGSARLEG
jgi:hypothetical protein